MRISDDGRGMISVLRVTDIQDKPKLFSTFMLQMLAELYSVCPEEGDLDKPKLIIFIDEAHLIFEEASKALLDRNKYRNKIDTFKRHWNLLLYTKPNGCSGKRFRAD